MYKQKKWVKILDVKSLSFCNSKKNNLVGFLLKYLFDVVYLNPDHRDFSKIIKWTLKLHRWDYLYSGGGGEVRMNYLKNKTRKSLSNKIVKVSVIYFGGYLIL